MAFKRLAGRIAIVTGSTEGIGFAIAERLSKEGAKVIVSSRKQEKVLKAVTKLEKQGLDVKGIVCHVADAQHRKKLFEQAKDLGGLDILVSNAGVNPEVAHVLDSSESSWNKIFEVNVKAGYLLAKEGLPLLRQSKAGRIIYISSIAGLHPLDLLGPYSVSKTAVIGLTKAVAQQLAMDNINVNCVSPGWIETKFSKAMTGTPETAEMSLTQIPMKRFGQPHEVAGVVAFLASDDASYITGENFVVAGGMQSRL